MIKNSYQSYMDPTKRTFVLLRPLDTFITEKMEDLLLIIMTIFTKSI
jgi:hypothetical protein